jgi:hypothetical protein
MSTRVFKGNPNWKNGIPRNSKIRIVTLPDATVVYENDRVSEQVSVDLDPGFYHVVIKKFLGKNAMGRLSQIRWEDRFFHDLTPEEYNVLATLRPTNAIGRLTSNGWTYMCKASGCEYSCNNPMAMVLHEMDHRGEAREDLIKNSDYFLDQQAEAAKEVAEAAIEPKKRGRPRSFHSET